MGDVGLEPTDDGAILYIFNPDTIRTCAYALATLRFALRSVPLQNMLQYLPISIILTLVRWATLARGRAALFLNGELLLLSFDYLIISLNDYIYNTLSLMFTNC